MTNTQPKKLVQIMEIVRDPRAAALARLNTALSDLASVDENVLLGHDPEFEDKECVRLAKKSILESILDLRPIDSVSAVMEFAASTYDDKFLKEVKSHLISRQLAGETLEERIVDYFAMSTFHEIFVNEANLKDKDDEDNEDNVIIDEDSIKTDKKYAKEYNQLACKNLNELFKEDYHKALKILLNIYLLHEKLDKDGDPTLSPIQMKLVDDIVVAEIKRFAASPTDHDPVLADGLSELVNHIKTDLNCDKLNQLLFDKMSNLRKQIYLLGAVEAVLADSNNGKAKVSNEIVGRYGKTRDDIALGFGEDTMDIIRTIRRIVNQTDDLDGAKPNLG